MHSLVNAQFVFYNERISDKKIKKAFQDSLVNVRQSRNLYDDFLQNFNEKGDSFIGLKLITYGGYEGTSISMYGNLRCYEPCARHFIELIERALTKLAYVNLRSATVLAIDQGYPDSTEYIYKFNGDLVFDEEEICKDRKLIRIL